ncbi:hypothetical protein Krac_3908 [Ktedonobacter racemifer DSM 44963]|uniref:Uncharacterized protein n=1 Tax=Ktedonobacter racemifer DSM 44963 TaxID=485913 RepID=D6U3K9_KTERA|nr:hypothetical protein Krac_3908 [Ktedonobacter racemifer DSM 44963]
MSGLAGDRGESVTGHRCWRTRVQCIRKSRKRFGVSSCLMNGQRLILEQLMSKDCDQRKESEQCRGGAQDGKVGPLPPRLSTQMSADLMRMSLPSAIAEQTIPGEFGPEPADRYTAALEDRTAPAGPE